MHTWCEVRNFAWHWLP